MVILEQELRLQLAETGDMLMLHTTAEMVDVAEFGAVVAAEQEVGVLITVRNVMLGVAAVVGALRQFQLQTALMKAILFFKSAAVEVVAE